MQAGDDTPSGTVAGQASGRQQITVCVVADGRLARVAAAIDSSTLDTLVAGRPLRQMYTPGPPPYVRELEWYQRNEPISFEGRRYYKNSPPLSLSPAELRLRGEYRQVPLFTDAGADPRAPVILYALIAPDCTFQAYYYFGDSRP
jgi:hypothetical protein